MRGEHVHNKLVRDGIPELIRRAGKTPVCRIAAEEEFGKLLQEKLYEEVREFVASGEVEELADILEVVAALAERKGVGLQELLAMAAAKREKRGGFAGRIVLEKVLEKNAVAGGKNENLP
ncbi:MAG: nucleoside triphosphate pyrophosphohydrolase [Firmicutes bacterium]|nr:nucleoside triphosphate pyrophosphohydrolase [Bacillota bacterium]